MKYKKRRKTKMKMKKSLLSHILCLTALQFSALAQESVLPRPFEVYGGTIGVIDAIQVPGDTNKTRVFVSTDSANSVFYGDVDHTKADPFATNNFVFTVLPDMDANANYGTPNWLAAHQESGRVFVGCSSGLLSCTTSAGSLVTETTTPMSFVLIQGSYFFAVNDPGIPETPKTLYYGAISAAGNLTLDAPLAMAFTGTVSLAINPSDNKVYVLCSQTSGFTLWKSSSDYDAFSSATTFSEISTTGVTVSPAQQVGISPDGRLFLGGGSSTLKIAYSDNGGGSWNNVDTGGLVAGGGSGLNIVCNGDTNAYEVFYGTVVSTNKGVDGSWIGLPRPGGYRPPSMHVNAGSTKIDPNNSQFIYVTTDKGIGGSANAGADVVELNNGLLAFQINDIDALTDKSVAWIASKAGIRIATNFSSSPVWTDGNFPDAIVYACGMDSDDPSGMTGYAGSCRLYRTTTGGGTNGSAWNQVWRWEDYLTDGEIRSVKAKGDFVALGYFSYAQNSPSGAVYVSSNTGSNWTAAISNINVNDMIVRDEAGTGIIYVAVSKSLAADRGGVYRIESSTVALDMTNEVNIRKMAEDSVGGIYASGTLPETSVPGRYCVVAYYRDTNAVWSMLPTNGLPGDFGDGDVLGRGLGPVITVGKDSATNDVPVLAVQRTIYYLPYGGSSWVTITNYPNGTQIKTLFYDELMVGTTIGLYGQGLDARPVTAAASVPLAADFDGDRLADPAVYNTNGNWKIKLSSANYATIPLTGFLGGAGYTALAADFDGDRKADPAIYNADLELWAVKLSSLNYLAPTVLTDFGGAGWQAIAGDFDGDRLADPALYNTNPSAGSGQAGTWKVKLSTAGYQTITAANLLGYAGCTAIAADFDRDGKVDPAIYSAASGSWIVVLSSMNYGTAIVNPWLLGSTGYFGMGADFDGDAYADPAVADPSTGSGQAGNWKVRLSSGNYILIDLPNFLGE